MAHRDAGNSFIPQASDVDLSGEPQLANLTDLPIPESHWRKVATAFHLPGHFYKVVTRKLTSIISIQRTHTFQDANEKLWMHTAMTNQDDPQAFAMAATYIESRKLTLAVMVGCSDDQIKDVKDLVGGWRDAMSHPLLMLGVCAELELNRLEDRVGKQTRDYVDLMNEIESERATRGHDRFSWELIKKVRSIREASKLAEEEVDATKSQLEKACVPAIQSVIEKNAPPAPSQSKSDKGSVTGLAATSSAPKSRGDSGATTPSASSSAATPVATTPSSSKTEPHSDGIVTTSADSSDDLTEITGLFRERFNDILSRLDGLSAKCRINVEGISFTTDIVSFV
jgi:hypothetical protein